MNDVNWNKLSFVKRSKYRKKVLQALSEPSMPSELADELDLHQSHVSRALIELKDKDLVEVLNPEDKQGRLYSKTEEGEEIRDKLDSS